MLENFKIAGIKFICIAISLTTIFANSVRADLCECVMVPNICPGCYQCNDPACYGDPNNFPGLDCIDYCVVGDSSEWCGKKCTESGDPNGSASASPTPACVSAFTNSGVNFSNLEVLAIPAGMTAIQNTSVQIGLYNLVNGVVTPLLEFGALATQTNNVFEFTATNTPLINNLPSTVSSEALAEMLASFFAQGAPNVLALTNTIPPEILTSAITCINFASLQMGSCFPAYLLNEGPELAEQTNFSGYQQSLLNNLGAPPVCETATPTVTPSISIAPSTTSTATLSSSATPRPTICNLALNPEGCSSPNPTSTATSTMQPPTSTATASLLPSPQPTCEVALLSFLGFGNNCPSNSPTPGPSVSSTSTLQPTSTATASMVASPTATCTVNCEVDPYSSSSPSSTISATSTASITATPTVSLTSTPSTTATSSISTTSTASITATPTVSLTSTPSTTATSSISTTSTASITATPTVSVTSNPGSSTSSTPSNTPPPSSVASSPSIVATSSVSITPTATMTASSTMTASITATPTVSLTSTPSISATSSVSTTPTATMTASSTSTASITATPTVSLTSSPSISATSSVSITPTVSVTSSPEASASNTPSSTEGMSPSPSASIPINPGNNSSSTPTATASTPPNLDNGEPSPSPSPCSLVENFQHLNADFDHNIKKYMGYVAQGNRREAFRLKKLDNSNANKRARESIVKANYFVALGTQLWFTVWNGVAHEILDCSGKQVSCTSVNSDTGIEKLKQGFEEGKKEAASLMKRLSKLASLSTQKKRDQELKKTLKKREEIVTKALQALIDKVGQNKYQQCSTIEKNKDEINILPF